MPPKAALASRAFALTKTPGFAVRRPTYAAKYFTSTNATSLTVVQKSIHSKEHLRAALLNVAARTRVR